MKYLLILSLICGLTGLYGETLSVEYTVDDVDPTGGSIILDEDSSWALAIWLEDASGDFVGTLKLNAGSDWHWLKEWESESMGVTTTFQEGTDPTVVNNIETVVGGKDALDPFLPFIETSGPFDITYLPDGDYSICLEIAEEVNPGTTNVARVGFTKDGNSGTSTTTTGSFGDVTITLVGRGTPVNNPPAVHAGPVIFADLGPAITLNGVITDPDTGGASARWEQVSGPGIAYFEDPDAMVTDVYFSKDGVYVLRLRGQDALETIYDQVMIAANCTIITPTLDVGIDSDDAGNDGEIYRVAHTALIEQEAYLKFDLSSITEPIGYAALLLSHRVNSLGAQTQTMNVQALYMDTWDATVDWASKPLGNFPLGTFSYPYLYNGWYWMSNLNLEAFMAGEQAGGSGDADDTATLRLHDEDVAAIIYYDINASETNVGPELILGHNATPSASLTASPTTGDFYLPVTFDATGTTDDNEFASPTETDYILKYEYDFDDSDGVDDWEEHPPIYTHTYLTAGTFTATVRVTDGRGASDMATQTITVSDPQWPGKFRFTNDTYTPYENVGTFDLTVQRYEGQTNAVSVVVTTSAGTAVNGTDYDDTSGTLNWADNDTANKTLTVTIYNIAGNDGNKTFTAALSSPSGTAPGGTASLGTPATTTVTIRDTDTKEESESGGCLPGTGSAITGLFLAGISGWLLRKRRS